jgi:hypothetical protein
MKTSSAFVALLIAAASAAGVARAQERTEEMPAAILDAERLERQIAALQPAVCAAELRLCNELEAFAKAAGPCFPEAERLTVGHAYLIEDDGKVRPAEYFVLRSYRAGEVTLVQTQHVFSENEEEKQAAEALVAGLKGGALDHANPLYRYLAENSGRVPHLLAHPQGRSLVVRAEGPTIYLRQTGRQLYAVLPEAVVTRPDAAQRVAGLLFSVLPAPALCD